MRRGGMRGCPTSLESERREEFTGEEEQREKVEIKNWQTGLEGKEDNSEPKGEGLAEEGIRKGESVGRNPTDIRKHRNTEYSYRQGFLGVLTNWKQ